MASHSDRRVFSFDLAPSHYEVRFFGGPLDGASVATDERPNCPYFVHQHLAREYLYRYRRLTAHAYRADFDGVLELESDALPPSQLPGVWPKIAIGIALLAAVCLVCGWFLAA